MIVSADLATMVGFCFGAFSTGWCAGWAMTNVQKVIEKVTGVGT